MIGTMRKNVCAQIELVHLDRSRIDVTGSFAYDLTRQVSNFHTVWDSDWRRRRKLRRKTRLEKKGGNASNMELWCNFPFPPTLCRVIYLSAHQPNLICVVRNSRTALTLERKTKKKKRKGRTSFIDPLDYRFSLSNASVLLRWILQNTFHASSDIFHTARRARNYAISKRFSNDRMDGIDKASRE